MSTLFMWVSVVAFFVAGLFIFKGGLETLEQKHSAKQVTEVSTPQETKKAPNKSLHQIDKPSLRSEQTGRGELKP